MVRMFDVCAGVVSENLSQLSKIVGKHMREFRLLNGLLGSFVFVIVAGYVCYPLYVTLTTSLHVNGSFSLTHYIDLLSPRNSAAWEAVWNSVLVSILTVSFSGVVGMVFAIVLTQIEFPGRELLSRFAILPIALPPLVGVISFLLVFGESGILPKVIQRMLMTTTVPFALDGIPAIVVVHVYSFYVYFYLFISTGLRRLDSSLIEAASGFGSTPWRTYRRIILPELRPALFGASILTFMASMASFSAPLLFAGEKRFMTLQIYTTKLNGYLDIAAAQSVLLTVISVGFFLLLKVSGESGIQRRMTRGSSRLGKLALGTLARAVLLTAFFLMVAIELLPILTIVAISFVREGSWTWQIVPTVFTIENYKKLLSDPHSFAPIGNSLLMSCIALVASVVVGVAAAYLIVKGGLQRTKSMFDALVTFPFAIPGTIIAISLILAFNSPNLLSGYTVLVGTFWILPLAYFIRLYPLVVRSTGAALGQLDDSLLEAGQSCGAGLWRRFRRIVFPLIAPGIVSGALLVTISALGEFVSSILLYTYSSRPISVEILSELRSYDFGGAAAYSVILLMFIMGIIYLSRLLLQRLHMGVTRQYF